MRTGRISTWVLLIIGALSIAPGLAAQDPQAGCDACQAVKDSESRRYTHVMAPLGLQADHIKKDVNNRKLSCSGDRGCIQRIELQEEQVLGQIEKAEADETARHEKAMVDIEHRPPCVDISMPEGACDRARAVKERRYSLNSAALKKRKIDDRNLYDHDLITCGVTSKTCKNDADNKQNRRLTKWQEDVDAENTLHYRELRIIESGATCEPPREQPDMVNAGPNPQRLIDAESKRHVLAVADITRLKDEELRGHATRLQHAGSNAQLIAEENQLHETRLRLLRIMLDQEGSRFDAAIARLKAH